MNEFIVDFTKNKIIVPSNDENQNCIYFKTFNTGRGIMLEVLDMDFKIDNMEFNINSPVDFNISELNSNLSKNDQIIKLDRDFLNILNVSIVDKDIELNKIKEYCSEFDFMLRRNNDKYTIDFTKHYDEKMIER